jgi:transketolase
MNVNAPMKSDTAASERDMANAIRVLAMDAVQAANSGHPGMPMGMADVATVLFNRFLKIDPSLPDWADRDRFVLSAGHGSMLLYAVHHLHRLFEDMTMEELSELPPAWREDGRSSGIRPCTGHRDDDRAARPGADHGCRHGACRTDDGGALRQEAGRPLHLRDRRRRLPAGRHQPRGDRPRGPFEAGRLIVLWDDNEISIDGKTPRCRRR